MFSTYLYIAYRKSHTTAALENQRVSRCVPELAVVPSLITCPKHTMQRHNHNIHQLIFIHNTPYGGIALGTPADPISVRRGAARLVLMNIQNPFKWLYGNP